MAKQGPTSIFLAICLLQSCFTLASAQEQKDIVAHLERELAIQNSQISDQEAISRDLQKQYDNALADIDRLLEEKKTYYENLSGLRSNLKDLKDSRDEAIGESKALLEDQIRLLREKFSQTTILLKEKQHAEARLENEIHKLRTKVEVVRTVVKEKELAIVHSGEKQAALERELNRLKKVTAQDALRNADLVKKIKKADSELKKVRALLDEKEAVTKKLEQNVRISKKKIQKAQKRNSDLENLIKGRSESVETLKKQYQAMEKTLAIISQEKASLQEGIAALK